MRTPISIEPGQLVERIRANVPAELLQMKRWCAWKPGKEGRKIPMSIYGCYASCTDESTWATFDLVSAPFLKNPRSVNGWGFNLAMSAPLGGLDLDDVVGADGSIEEKYRLILGHLGSYTEYSPSGTGLHCFFLYEGDGPENRKTKDVELYLRAHFLSVTGDVFEGRHKLRDGTIGAARIEQALRPRMPLLPRVPLRDVPQNDNELIEKMFACRRGPTIKRLWDGECLHKSDSESDFALMGDLNFWCGGDIDRMIALFLTSGRAERAKGRRSDYLQRMAQKVAK